MGRHFGILGRGAICGRAREGRRRAQRVDGRRRGDGGRRDLAIAAIAEFRQMAGRFGKDRRLAHTGESAVFLEAGFAIAAQKVFSANGGNCS